MSARVLVVTRGRDLVGVDAQRDRVDVAEDRLRAGLDDHVRGRRPGQRGRQHLVAGADPERDERQVHRGRAGRDRERMLDAAVGGELLLELRRERSGREPAGLERVQHVRALLVAERGRSEAERRCAGARCHGGKSTGWIRRSDFSGRSLDPLAPSVLTPSAEDARACPRSDRRATSGGRATRRRGASRRSGRSSPRGSPGSSSGRSCGSRVA